MQIDPGQVYTSEEVAKMLKTPVSTIKELCRRGKLKAINIGFGISKYRILGKQLIKFIGLED